MNKLLDTRLQTCLYGWIMPGRYQQAHSRGYYLLSTAFNTGACHEDSITVGSQLNDGIKQSMVVKLCDSSTLKHASLASLGHSDKIASKVKVKVK